MHFKPMLFEGNSMQMKEYGCCLHYQLQPIHYKLLNLSIQPIYYKLLNIQKFKSIHIYYLTITMDQESGSFM